MRLLSAAPAQMMRRILLSLCLVLCACAAWAQPYPNKPVRLVVPFAPGSLTDAVARLLAEELGRRFKQSFVVDDRPGANGQIGTALVAKSPADGYTLLVSSNTTHAANPHLYKKLNYDPVKDFTPLARLGSIPFMLLVNAELPARNMDEFLALARAQGDRLAFSHANSTSLVTAETINVMAGLRMVAVPYKSSPQAIVDLMGNVVQMMVCDFAVAMPHVKSGKLRALAVPMAKRTVFKPELPPIADSLKGFDFTPWSGIFAPAGTPKDVIERLSGALNEILARPDMAAKLASVGVEVNPLPPDEFARFIRQEIDHWGRLVKAARIEPE